MAGTVTPNSQIVKSGMTSVGFDSTGAPAAGAGHTFGKLAVGVYATSGVTVTASHLGLSTIWTLNLTPNDASITKNVSATVNIATGGKSATVVMYDTDSTLSEVSNSVDAGTWAFAASGILAGQGDNS